jgi:hypothetical protein
VDQSPSYWYRSDLAQGDPPKPRKPVSMITA